MMKLTLSKILFLGAIALTGNLGLGACSDHGAAPTKAQADVNDPNAEALKDLARAVEGLNRKMDGLKPPPTGPTAEEIASAVKDAVQPDQDKDGMPDAIDKCVDKAEDKDQFEDEDGCPELDNDGDGFADSADKCPDDSGMPYADDDEWVGCPPRKEDVDKDGILNEDDACIGQPGPKTDVEETNGCPDDEADLDGDGIKDGVDKCIVEKGVANDDPNKNGCPVEIDMSADTPPPPATATATDCHDKPAKVVKPLTDPERITKLEKEMAGQRGQWDAIKALRDKDVEQDKLLAKYGQRLSDGWTEPKKPVPAPAPSGGVVSLGEPGLIVKP